VVGDTFLDYQLQMLHRLCPPLEAVGLGGSTGRGEADDLSDLDFFLLVSDAEFFAAVERFPDLITHPQPPVAHWRRGFTPNFGFTFAYFYRDGISVEYMLHCHRSLRRTPMALSTRITRDLTGFYTGFLESLPGSAELSRDGYTADATGEFIAELLKLSKYAQRGELPAIVHRFERLRLVFIGLERYLTRGEPYAPHDSDKRVYRDLGQAGETMLSPTFCELDPQAALAAFRVLYRGIKERLDRLAPSIETGDAGELAAGLSARIEDGLVRMASARGQGGTITGERRMSP
jgi:hypothetical protein